MDTRRRQTQHRTAPLAAFHPLQGVAFLAGLAVVYILPPWPSWPLWPAGGLVIVLLWRRAPFTAGCIMFALLGALWMSYTAQQRLDRQWPEQRHGEDVRLHGRIDGIPERKGRHWRFHFLPQDTAYGRLRVTWYRSDADLKAGQCWHMQLRMRSPHGSVNPGGFDYEGWLFRQGVSATAYVRQARPCASQTDENAGLAGLREAWRTQLDAYLESHPAAAQVLALTLGLRDGFRPADWDLLRATGTSHLMAISGLHIGLIAGWLYALTLWLWRLSPRLTAWTAAPRAAIVASAIGALAYALVSGFGLPAQRALMMLLVLYWAMWSGRRIPASHGLALALIAVLLLDPFAVASAGFWLSFAAVAWIFYLLGRRWQMAGRLQGYLKIQCFLTLALAPLTLYWFGQTAWIAPFVNLLLIPLFSVLIPWLLLSVGLVIAGSPYAGPLLLSAADTLHWIWQGLQWVQAYTPGMVSTSVAAPWAVAVALAGLIWFCAPRGWPARAGGLLLCVPLFLNQGAPTAQGSLRLTVLDVGQGLAVVAETRNHVLLYDAGPAYPGGFDAGAMVVVPYLRYRGHERLDAIIQSHGDLDHRGGIQAVRQAMPSGGFYGSPHRPCRAGMRWHWDGVDFEFLHPDSGAWQGNNRSCVLRISAGGHAALLTGDIEAQVERKLIREQAAKLDADLLVAPHHGSASSSSQRFLNTVTPRISIFSAGWRNRWGFPRQEVLARYERVGSQLFFTGEQGAVITVLAPGTPIQTPVLWRQQTPRLWRQDTAHWP